MTAGAVSIDDLAPTQESLPTGRAAVALVRTMAAIPAVTLITLNNDSPFPRSFAAVRALDVGHGEFSPLRYPDFFDPETSSEPCAGPPPTRAIRFSPSGARPSFNTKRPTPALFPHHLYPHACSILSPKPLPRTRHLPISVLRRKPAPALSAGTGPFDEPTCISTSSRVLLLHRRARASRMRLHSSPALSLRQRREQ